MVWVPAGSPLDPAALGIRVLEARFGAAHRHRQPAACSVWARRRCGPALARRVRSRVAEARLGENIAQAFEFVESGAAEAGIVALSLALAPALRGHGRYWEVPQEAYPKIEQGGVILARAPAGPAAQFRAFLLSPEARRILKQYGFAEPQ